jgi:hypothetical protein
MRHRNQRLIPFDVFLQGNFLGEFYFPQGTSWQKVISSLITAGFPQGIRVRCRFTRKG